MKVLVTGAAGFIGSNLVIRLLETGDTVIGIDNHNDYYDPSLKEARVARYENHRNYTHLRLDIRDGESLEKSFQTYKPECVVNLAAQAGVRYSIDNPMSYINNNIVGFANVLEACRQHQINHLVYASSSSVYGANTLVPFSIQHNVNHPISLYAASKRSNELMAHTYSHLYGIPTTGLRFFTVYGPWGRPDMALFKFAKLILSGEKIPVYNNGQHERDFTYVDDVVEGMVRILRSPARPNVEWESTNPEPGTSSAPWRLYNIGSDNPIQLLDYISLLEKELGLKAEVEMLPVQPGDIEKTRADVSELVDQFGYMPKTPIGVGVARFARWYKEFYKK